MENKISKKQKKADDILKSFLNHLEKKGFDKEICQYLNLAWRGITCEKMVSNLRGVKFVVREYEFEKLTTPELIYSYLVEINSEKIKLFVQPLYEVGVPYDNGKYGVIPAKLSRFIPKENLNKEPIKLTEKGIEKEMQDVEKELDTKIVPDKKTSKTTSKNKPYNKRKGKK